MKMVAMCAAFLLIVCGCQGPVDDPQVLALRQRYVVTAEPANAISLTDAADLISAKEAGTEPQPLAIIGRIHAGDLEPWEPGKASFMLSELPAEGHGEGHDADNCPFCKRRAAKSPTAIVKFVDGIGETISIDARKLFELGKNQTVVVSGHLNQGEFNTIVLTADQLYVRNK